MNSLNKKITIAAVIVLILCAGIYAWNYADNLEQHINERINNVK